MKPKSLFTLVLIFTACSSNPNSVPLNYPIQSPKPNSTESPNPNSTSTPSPEASRRPGSTDAIGWTDLIMDANKTKTDLDLTGHFSTTKNYCMQYAYGVLSPESWDRIAGYINSAIAQPSLPSPTYCTPAPDLFPYMDGTVEVALTEGKRTLYITKGYEICSTISDSNLSDLLLAELHKLVLTADYEDCDKRRPR